MTTQVSSSEDLLDFFKGSPWKIRFKLIGLFLLAVVVAVGSVGLSGFLMYLSVRYKPAPEKPFHHSPVPVSAFKAPYEIKEVAVPLLNAQGTRIAYAQFTLILDCPTEEAKEAMALFRPKLLDAIFEAASDLKLEEFSSNVGFDKFKSKLLELYQGSLGKAAPRALAIKDWVLN